MARKARSKSPKRSRRSSRKSSKKAGSRKKVNKWITTVKREAKKLGLSYKDALSDPRVKAAYKKA